jgi:ArsR family transcriptional regulator, virulence genes transcriptional regulator
MVTGKTAAVSVKAPSANPATFDLRAMQRNAASAAQLMRSLANPHRLLVLCVLSEGEMSVSELNRRIPLSQSALSQHLAVLRQEKLVRTRRESQTIYYSVVAGAAMDIVRLLHDKFCCVQVPPRAYRRADPTNGKGAKTR